MVHVIEKTKNKKQKTLLGLPSSTKWARPFSNGSHLAPDRLPMKLDLSPDIVTWPPSLASCLASTFFHHTPYCLLSCRYSCVHPNPHCVGKSPPVCQFSSTLLLTLPWPDGWDLHSSSHVLQFGSVQMLWPGDSIRSYRLTTQSHKTILSLHCRCPL